MRRISIINQKGGVGKTTSTVNIGHALSLLGHRVLVLDMDPQGHLATSLGLEHRDAAGVDAVLLDNATLAQVAIEMRDGLTLVPAGPRLAEFEFVANGGAKRGWLLNQALDEYGKDLDFVLLDCPPSSGLLVMNALLASQEVLVPVSGDYLSLDGLSRFMGIQDHISRTLKRNTREWIAVTRFNERRRLSRRVHMTLLEYFPGKVLATPVRETAALAESPSAGKTIFDYQSKSRGAEDYRALAQDLVNGRTL
jgi:chromosome partitioning protein